MSRLSAFAVLSAAGALVLLAALCPAQVPQKINYQVMLTDDDDEPLADESVTMVFTIYDHETVGTALWTETQNVTTNSIGVVSVLLGDVHPIDIDFDSPLWLEVEVGGETLSPRRALVGAPYAITDETGGGDDHSLDADDGDPINVVYVDSGGNVGIGTTSPEEELHVQGNVLVESPTTNAEVTIAHGDPQVDAVELRATQLYGGSAAYYDENTNWAVGLGAHPNAPGGHLELARDESGNLAFRLMGDYFGSGEPRMDILGTSGEIVFDLSESQTDAVQLPAGAIDAGEIWNEPGIQSGQSATEIALTGGGSYNQINHGEIYCPGGGYVLAIATAQVNVYHDGTASSAWFGISETNTEFSDLAQEITVSLSGGVPAGSYSLPLTLNAVFEVGYSGNETLYFMARETLGDWSVSSRQLTLLYVPSAYGDIDMNDKPVPDDVTPAGAAMRRPTLEEQRRDAAGPVGSGIATQAELADLRERVLELERKMAVR